MGLDASITVVPPGEYRKYLKDPMKYVFPRTLKRPLDFFREWQELDLALHEMGAPLKLTLRGDKTNGESFGSECYSAFVSAGLVKKLDEALARVSDDILLAALKETGLRLRKYEHKYYIGAMKAIKTAYRSAAKSNGYLWILIC